MTSRHEMTGKIRMSELVPRMKRRLRGSVVHSAMLRAQLARQRTGTALAHSSETIRTTTSWLWHSRESSNFTYDLTPLNIGQLTWFVSHVTGTEPEQIRSYIDELKQDDVLGQHLRHMRDGAVTPARPDDRPVHYGRRLGWYAAVRATKPAVVVESGVDKGLGTCVLAAAVLRNVEEGFGGRVVAIDIDPVAGAWLADPYSQVVDLVIDDSLKALAGMSDEVGLFIHDSNHTPQHERAEYEVVTGRLAPDGLIFSDNAHVSSELAEYAERTGRRFLYFAERPMAHWYGGAGIGAGFR